MRVDSTAIETDVHDPTDASLLWDGMRIITRWLDERYPFNPRPDYRYSDHLRVAKKRLLAVTNAKKEADRVSAYRDMVHYADKVVGYAKGAIVAFDGYQAANLRSMLTALGLRANLKRAVELLEKLSTRPSGVFSAERRFPSRRRSSPTSKSILTSS